LICVNGSAYSASGSARALSGACHDRRAASDDATERSARNLRIGLSSLGDAEIDPDCSGIFTQ
jgi:hypothetical protein